MFWALRIKTNASFWDLGKHDGFISLLSDVQVNQKTQTGRD